MKYLLVLFFIIQFYNVQVFCQIPVGSWRLHLPSNNVNQITYSNDKAFATTGESLFSYSLKDNKVEQLSKISGLSDFGAQSIAYADDAGTLIIGYSNGNIDLMHNKTITNISDLKNKSLSADKSINHILTYGNMAYLSCGFGILLLNLEKSEIKDTYIFGPGGEYLNVNACAILNDTIYAATENGLYKAWLNDPLLIDYNRWTVISDMPNAGKSFRKVSVQNNVLFALYNSSNTGKDSIYYYKDHTWGNIALNESTEIYDIFVSDNQYIVSTSINLKYLDSKFSLVSEVWQYPEIGSAAPREVLKDSKGNTWIADYGNGLIRIQSNGNYDQIRPKGPISSKIRSFAYVNNKLYTAAGGVNSSNNNLYNAGEYSVFSNEEWTSYQNMDAFDFMAIRTDPADEKKLYISSFGSGLFIYKDGVIQNHFDEFNSTLQNAISGSQYVRIGGMDFDSNSNLWMSNSYVNNTLSVFKSDGTWKAFPYKSALGTDVVGDVVVDNYNHIWVILLDGSGIMVLNNNNTIDNTDDDVMVKFKPQNIYGESVSAYTLAKDLDGNIWVGTDYGPVVYSYPEEVFDGNTTGTQPTISKNGNSYPLLGQELVRAIAVDGANRKWLGTEKGGVFLVSADGDSSLLSFNTENSPIMSNLINGIGIQGGTGEVFFGTDKGIISYRSDATDGGDDFGDVYVFPNPVRPTYHGTITITGLIKDATIKITDITGNLVYEMKSNGGTATWDGNNFDGRRAASGVYLVFCTNDDGSKTHITKLLLLK